MSMRGARCALCLTGLAAIVLLPGAGISGFVSRAAAADSVVTVKYRSTILGQERELIVHLPRDYDAAHRYPVLYVLDGSSQDQPLADKLDSLYREKAGLQAIVVGIPNTPETAGNGGLMRGFPRRPSSDSMSAVSSPQMYAPAPLCT